MMDDLDTFDINKLLPIQWKSYGDWLMATHNPPKSYKEHPFDSQEALMACKKDFQKHIGMSLGKYIRLRRVDYLLQQKNPKFHDNLIIDYMTTKIGKMIAVFYQKKLCLLEFMDRKMLEKELLALQKKFKANFVWQATHYTKQLQTELDGYFLGQTKQFKTALHLVGTEFQCNVWRMLLQIPYGKTSSYKQQAQSMGNVNAIRAIAAANGYNKISILVPCHRVIGSDGSLVGYGGGIERKRFLLALEQSFL